MVGRRSFPFGILPIFRGKLCSFHVVPAATAASYFRMGFWPIQKMASQATGWICMDECERGVNWKWGMCVCVCPQHVESSFVFVFFLSKMVAFDQETSVPLFCWFFVQFFSTFWRGTATQRQSSKQSAWHWRWPARARLILFIWGCGIQTGCHLKQ